MIVEICLFLVLVFAYYVVKDMKPKGMPPGPWEIPFLGNRLIFNVKYMLGLREKYGDVVTTRLAHARTVLVYDYHLAKEAMASVDLADRPPFSKDFSLDDRKIGGVLSANGIYWQHDRRFLLKNLRNLGMGKTSLEAAIQTEADAMVEDLRTYAGKTVEETPLTLRTVALNVIWQLVAGKRYDLRSEEVLAVFEKTNSARKKFTPIMMAYFFAPTWFRNILPQYIKLKVFKTDLFDDLLEDMKSIFTKHVDEGKEKLQNGTDGDDVISEYLREMERCKDDKDSMFWRGKLLQNVSDLFSAGSDTVFNMMKWTVYLMARYPELLKEMRQQIDDVTPKGERVSLSRKNDFPLIEAFITESLRYSSMVILNVQRCAARDTQLNGYFIPEGTIVQVVNLYVHHDPKFWENPQDFNPRRFITPEGKFQAPKEGFFAFGSGRRQCLGETLARMEYLLFTATLIHNFDIKVPEGVTLNTEFDDGVGLRLPKDQPLLFEFRE